MTDDVLSLVTGGKQSFTTATTAPQQAAQSPSDYADLITAKEQQYGLPDGLLHGIIYRGEKSGITAVSPKGAMGIAQLMPSTAKDLGVDPKDPAQAIDGAARYLKQQLDAHNGDQTLAVAAYNAGPAAVAKYGGVPPYKETQDYVGRVLGTGAGAAGQSGDDVLSMVTGGKASFGSAPATSTQAVAPTPAQPAADAPRVSNDIVNPTTNQSYNSAQVKTLQQLAKAGTLDMAQSAPMTEAGTLKLPYVQTDKDVVPEGPGVYYIDLDGKLQQTAGKPVTPLEGLAHGAGQGVEDVGASINNADVALKGALAKYPALNVLLPGVAVGNMINQQANKLIGTPTAEDLQNRMLTDRNAYDARYGANGYATGGRIGGNIAASAPLLATGEGALADAGPLGEFLAGQAGRGGGAGAANLLLRGGSLATNGAIQGGGAAALTSAASDEPVLDQIRNGAEFGGVLGVAVPAAYGAAAKAGSGVSRILEPFTESGQNKAANRIINQFAEGGPKDINLTELVSGAKPTLAQATGNPGLAVLERGLKTDATGSQALTGRAMQNADARVTFVDALRGDPATLDSLKEQRDTQALPLLRKAMENAQPTTPVPVIAKIDQILQSPSGQRDVVQSALGKIRDKLVQVDPQSGQVWFQRDPEQLYGIRQAIDDSLNPLSHGTANDQRLASRELIDVKGELDKAIEQGAPGFKDYLTQYSKLSQPVNELSYLQSLGITDSKGNVTLGKVSNALNQINKLRQANGVNGAKSLSDDTLKALGNLRDDLKREGNSTLGTGSGSDTVQKLATNALLQKGGVPMALGAAAVSHNPLVGLAISGAKSAYDVKSKEIQQRLINLMLNPDSSALSLEGSRVVGGSGNALTSAATGAPSAAVTNVSKLPGLIKKQALPAAVTAKNRLTGAASQ